MKAKNDKITYNYKTGLYEIKVNGVDMNCMSESDAEEALEFYGKPTLKGKIEENLDFNYIEDQVGGDHYKNQDIQPWDYMEACMTEEQFIGYLRGNVIKYVSRYDKKGGIQDIDKALQYLNKLRSAL